MLGWVLEAAKLQPIYSASWQGIIHHRSCVALTVS